MEEGEAKRMIDLQPPQAAKVNQADRVIENDGSLAELHAQLDAIWEDLKRRYPRRMTTQVPQRSPERTWTFCGRFWAEHTTLSNWAVLAIGFVVILIFSARGVGFEGAQWAALIGVTVGLPDCALGS